mgnify:FL=1
MSEPTKTPPETEQELCERLYLREALTLAECAIACDCSEEVFRRRLVRYNIERRPRGLPPTPLQDRRRAEG